MKLSRITLGLSLAAALIQAHAEILQLRVGGQIVQKEEGQGVGNPSTIPQSDPAGSDLIRFENGDIMHGIFGGISEGLIWKRQDIEQPIHFQMQSVRQIILKSTEQTGITEGTSLITLINGDSIPGEIISLNEKELTITSQVIGQITIPRDRIRAIAPNPFDGQLLYAGPFTSDGWMRLDYQDAKKEDLKDQTDEEIGEDQKDEDIQKKITEEAPPSWVHSGAAFYSISRLPLAFDPGLPEVGRLRFKVAFKAQMTLNIALHSDFARPILPEIKEEAEATDDQEEEKEGEPLEEDIQPEGGKKPALKLEKLMDLNKGGPLQSIPWMRPGQGTHADFFGTGYLLNIYSSYPNLNRCSFNEDGRPVLSRLKATRSSVALPQSGEAEIDIRFDRPNNLIMLFINGEYAAQWSDPEGYLAQGTGIGFLNGSDNQVRISDIVVTSWNGVLDSAKSMDHPDRDIALLTNGTDRFSGELQGISDGKARIKTNYAELEIPLSDLSEVELKTTGHANLDDASFEWESDPTSILFKPYGLIRINTKSATPESMSGTSPFLGNISVNLKSAVMLRFLDESPDISDWFE